MPAEREVKCPKCGTPKMTKAARNNRLRCSNCGDQFLAPAPPQAQAEPQAPAKKAVAKKAAPAKPKGTTVVKADGTTIRKTTKKRAAKTPTPAKAAKAEDAKDQAPKDPYEPPPFQERSKHSGRRGGLAFYKSRYGKKKAASA